MEKRVDKSRRDFLRQGAGALTGVLAAPVVVPPSALGRSATPPSDRVTVGIIGSGQRAVFETLQYPCFDKVVIVAVADVVRDHRESAKEKLEKQYELLQPGRPNRGIRMYEDFQELQAQKDINGVYNVAPDHWHVSMLLRSEAVRAASARTPQPRNPHVRGLPGAAGAERHQWRL